MTETTEQRLRALEPLYFQHVAYFECADGWAGLIEEVVLTLKKRRNKFHRFSQVKEKLGLLRMYSQAVRPSYADWWYTYAEEIEKRSGTICEVCGEPGTRAGSVTGWSWIRTLCAEHRKT